MPQRFIGVLAILLGLGLAAWAGSGLDFSGEVSAAMEASGTIQHMPVSPDVYSWRAKILAAVLAIVGALCIVGGVALIMRKGWAIGVLAVAAVLPLLFPIASRIAAPPDFQFQGPTLPDILVFSLVGLVAAMAFMFRSPEAASPDK